MPKKEITTKNKEYHFAKSLSAAELQVLCLIKEGHHSKDIAHIRKCSTRTIEKHRSSIIKKLKIESSQHAILIWIMQNRQYFDT